MGLFGRRRGEEPPGDGGVPQGKGGPGPADAAGAELAGLESGIAEKKAELGRLEGRTAEVRKEYEAAVSSLMAVKRELNESRTALAVAQREHRAALVRLKEHERISGESRKAEYSRTEGGLRRMREELAGLEAERKKTAGEAERERAELHEIRRQKIGVRQELEEASSRLHDAREELGGDAGGGALAPDERRIIEGGGRDPGGVIEAASAVVGSLKSRLEAAQRELDSVQGLLEKERAAHAEARRELDRLGSEQPL